MQLIATSNGSIEFTEIHANCYTTRRRESPTAPSFRRAQLFPSYRSPQHSSILIGMSFDSEYSLTPYSTYSPNTNAIMDCACIKYAAYIIEFLNARHRENHFLFKDNILRPRTSFLRTNNNVGSQKRCLWHPIQINDLDIFSETITCSPSQKRCPWARKFSEKLSLEASLASVRAFRWNRAVNAVDQICTTSRPKPVHLISHS